MHDPQEEVRRKAALFLAYSDTTTTEAIPILIYAAEDSKTVCDAVASLGRYGSAADDAVPVLADLDLMNKYPGEHPCSPAKALERIGTPDALAALELLRKWDRKWSAHEERLFKALADPNPEVRGNAAGELSGIALALKLKSIESYKTEEIAAALKRLLHDPTKNYAIARHLSVRYRCYCYQHGSDTRPDRGGQDTEVDDYSCAAIAALGGYGPRRRCRAHTAGPGLMKSTDLPAAHPCSPDALARIGTRRLWPPSNC